MSAVTLTLPGHKIDAMRAYIETGEMLLSTYQLAGFTTMLQLHINDDRAEGFAQIALMVSGEREAVEQELIKRGIQRELLSYHDDDRKTIASWKITLIGHEMAVVASHYKASRFLNKEAC